MWCPEGPPLECATMQTSISLRIRNETVPNITDVREVSFPQAISGSDGFWRPEMPCAGRSERRGRANASQRGALGLVPPGRCRGAESGRHQLLWGADMCGCFFVCYFRCPTNHQTIHVPLWGNHFQVLLPSDYLQVGFVLASVVACQCQTVSWLYKVCRFAALLSLGLWTVAMPWSTGRSLLFQQLLSRACGGRCECHCLEWGEGRWSFRYSDIADLQDLITISHFSFHQHFESAVSISTR